MRLYALALGIVLAALISVGALVSHTGNSLTPRPSVQLHRFCGGKCLCDGGVANQSLMQRVCPDGWEEGLGTARRKIRIQRRMRRERIRKLREAAPPPSLPPSV